MVERDYVRLILVDPFEPVAARPWLVQHTDVALVYGDPLILARFLIDSSEPGDLIVAGSEEAVLPSAMAVSQPPVRETERRCLGLQICPALRCTDRRLQRLALPTALNPHWEVGLSIEPRFPLVLKAPASALSHGVQIVTYPEELLPAAIKVQAAGNPYLDRFERLMGRSPGYAFISEEYLDGPQYEISGISGGEGILWMFAPLLQEWDPAGGTIVRYQYVEDVRLAVNLARIASQAVAALGLSWCGWCVEIRGDKVIEAHARMGEDSPEKGYPRGRLETVCDLLWAELTR